MIEKPVSEIYQKLLTDEAVIFSNQYFVLLERRINKEEVNFPAELMAHFSKDTGLMTNDLHENETMELFRTHKYLILEKQDSTFQKSTYDLESPEFVAFQSDFIKEVKKQYVQMFENLIEEEKTAFSENDESLLYSANRKYKKDPDVSEEEEEKSRLESIKEIVEEMLEQQAKIQKLKGFQQQLLSI